MVTKKPFSQEKDVIAADANVFLHSDDNKKVQYYAKVTRLVPGNDKRQFFTSTFEKVCDKTLTIEDGSSKGKKILFKSASFYPIQKIGGALSM